MHICRLNVRRSCLAPLADPIWNAVRNRWDAPIRRGYPRAGPWPEPCLEIPGCFWRGSGGERAQPGCTQEVCAQETAAASPCGQEAFDQRALEEPEPWPKALTVKWTPSYSA